MCVFNLVNKLKVCIKCNMATLWYHVIQLSALLVNSLRCSRKARIANKISLGNYGENLPQQTTFSPYRVLTSKLIQQGVLVRGICLCVWQIPQAFASIKLPREALEDEERSRRDSPLPPYMPFAILRYPRNRVFTCDLVSRDSTRLCKL